MNQEEAFKIAMEAQFIEPIKLGPWSSYSLLDDPKHLCFVLSRYKFCSKLLEGKDNILEIGVGDALGTPLVAKIAKHILAIDSNEPIIESNKILLPKTIKNIEFLYHNICKAPIDTTFDGAFSIDVIEHLDSDVEEAFMTNISKSLNSDGIYIMGTPNITASVYATYRSAVQHINLKSHASLRELMVKYYRNVLMFGMNDETLHTGFGDMAHYLFAVGIAPR